MRIADEDLPFLSERKVKSTKSHSNSDYEITRAHKKVYKTFNINPEPHNKLTASVRDKINMCYTFPCSKRHCVMV